MPVLGLAKLHLKKWKSNAQNKKHKPKGIEKVRQ